MDDHAPLLGDPASFLHSASGSQQSTSRGGTLTPGQGKKDVKAQMPPGRAGSVVDTGKKVATPAAPTIGRRKSKGAGLG